MSQTAFQGPGSTDRLTVGVAARLSRYLQVLTQARKMGKERISSQEISDYTNINATQIRRDLSGFGKFGKRGVGYNIDSLIAEIRRILDDEGVRYTEVDITGDPELEAAHREWLPVVEIDGERAFVYFVDEDALRRRVSQT